MEPDILFETDDVMVVHKPSGMKVHRDGTDGAETLADWFLARCPAASAVGEPIRLSDGTELARPGIVHRIDRETSGAVVLAKTRAAHARLKRAFAERTVKKVYYAFCYGTPKEPHGTIDRPLGRSARDFRLRATGRGTRGTLREAVTHYRVLHTENGISFVRVVPETGRTHQIRVHFKALQHPLVCDSLYAKGKECLLGFARLALHAHTLTFPTAVGEQTVVAPFPDDFRHAAAKLGVSLETPPVNLPG